MLPCSKNLVKNYKIAPFTSFSSLAIFHSFTRTSEILPTISLQTGCRQQQFQSYEKFLRERTYYIFANLDTSFQPDLRVTIYFTPYQPLASVAHFLLLQTSFVYVLIVHLLLDVHCPPTYCFSLLFTSPRCHRYAFLLHHMLLFSRSIVSSIASFRFLFNFISMGWR